MEQKFICENLSEKDGRLYFAGMDTAELAKKYGTPLYLMDEDRIREKCRIYKTAMQRCFAAGSAPLYASKACSFAQIYRIMADEGLGIDVVSCGEIFTAKKAGFALQNAYFHSNNKTDADIAYAMDNGLGHFVADNVEEVKAVEREAAARGIVQKLMLRITPGIDTHTYEAVNTGKVDSKFGSAIETGQAEDIMIFTLQQPHIELEGFHCHVGSQVFGEDVFERAAVIMLEFMAEMQQKHGFKAKVLDLGGGYGVRYTESDPFLDIEAKIESVADAVHAACGRLGIEEPVVMLEPGRGIVADAGLTLYTAGTVKTIPGYKTYVSIDGGMGDNPRFALYRSRYTVLPASRMNEERDMTCSVVGRCCESGDIIQENVPMPQATGRGDLVAVCTTGAYNYSMASHYNRLPKPPVVMIKDGTSYVAVRRETVEDVAALDI